MENKFKPNSNQMKHPEKWYIPVTRENHAELNQWRLSKRTQEASKWDYSFVPGATLLSAHPYNDGSYFYAKRCRIDETERDNGYQEITLEQFREITNPKPMKHPEKWYIPVTEENHAELNRWRLSKRTSKTSKWDYLFIPGTLLVSKHPYDGTYFFSNFGNFLKCHYQEITLEQFRQITNSQPMKHPEHWCIEATEENFKELYAWWRNNAAERYTNFHVGYTLVSDHPCDKSRYYGGDIKNCIDDYPQFVEITLEQFREITNPQPMKHPEKWYIPVTQENCDELSRWRQSVATSHILHRLRPKLDVLLSSRIASGSYYFAGNVDDFRRNSNYKDYQEITLEQFREITNSNQTQTTMSKSIQISRELLNEYYNAATTPQKEYLTEHFKLDGTTTEEAIRGLHDMACERWKPKIKKNHPDCFPEESKYFDFSKHVDKFGQQRVVPEDICESLGLAGDFIQVRNNRSNPETHHRSFYLSNQYNWELKFEGGAMVLIPTKKSC
jgi:hypothetical protein